MAIWIKPLEIADVNGNGTGKWRLTASSDEDGGGPYGLCQHEHDTADEAIACQEAQEESKHWGR